MHPFESEPSVVEPLPMRQKPDSDNRRQREETDGGNPPLGAVGIGPDQCRDVLASEDVEKQGQNVPFRARTVLHKLYK